VTIATGQIMRFHEYPTSYASNLMPNTTSNTTLSNFLKILHDDLKVSDAGGAYISDAERVFKRYGYNRKKVDHSVFEVDVSLTKKNPVYMRGTHQETNEGHAWVCDGSKSLQPRTEYRMYELLFSNNKPYMMDEFAQEIIYGDIYTMYHMNWGWKGLNDGYFYDKYIDVPSNGTRYNFSSGRQDLIISK
ncbi:MAG: C10 family peptidase, partial [Bacteroidales bacterium]|nr:C10 family peptidase [Bacteroidales bacterium]